MVNDVKPGGVFLHQLPVGLRMSSNEHMPAEAKRYIAKNNIQLYTVNAIDIAAKIGLGKRTNTVLQSAFFALAKILPEEEAIGYMKEKAQKFMKKGKEIVEMNEKAIDAGATAYVKIDVPADWKLTLSTLPRLSRRERPREARQDGRRHHETGRP